MRDQCSANTQHLGLTPCRCTAHVLSPPSALMTPLLSASKSSQVWVQFLHRGVLVYAVLMRCMQRESRSIGGSTSPVEHLRTHLPSPYVTDTLGTYLSRRNMAFSPSTRFLHHKFYCSRTRVDKPPIEHHIVIKHTATCVSAQVLWKSGQAHLHSDVLRSMPARVVGISRTYDPVMRFKGCLHYLNHCF